MTDFTSHPKPNTVILAAQLAEHFEKFLSYQNRSKDPFVIVTSGANQNFTINVGKAYIEGYEVGESGDSSFAGTFTPSATNHIFIQKDGTIVQNTTGTPPANSYKLFTVTTDGTGTTGVTDEQTDTIEFDDPLVVQTLESLGFLKGLHANLVQVDPYVRLEDTNTGTIRRIWLVGSELRVTDDSGATVYTQDLANISNPVDETDTNATKDKTVSNLLAKGWQDTKTTVDAATSAATVNTLAKRDGSGRFKAAAPSASTDVAIKSTVDAVQTNLTNHESASDPHTAYVRADGTRAFTANQSMGGFRLTSLAAPTTGSDAARKTEVDLKVSKAGDTMTGNLTMNTGAGTDAILKEGGVERNSGSAEVFDIANPGAGTMELRVDGNKVWHAGNDGSGSGLDADLLDGLNQTASATANTIMRRDASGRAQIAAPSAAADIARKDTVDAVQTNLTSHEGAADPHTQYILANGTRAFTAAQSMGGFKLTNLAGPTSDNDAVRKSYVDTQLADVDVIGDVFMLGGM